MNRFILVLALGVLFQHSGVHAQAVQRTSINVPGTSSPSAFDELIAIGFENRLPIGIIVDGPDAEICQTPLNLKHGTVTAADLSRLIGAAMPKYRVDFEDGVLNVIPKTLPSGATQLLEMKLSHLVTGPKSHPLLGFELWRAVTAVIAPNLGSNLNSLSSLDDETVSGLDVKNESVWSILNTIAGKGNGGMWILDSSRVKELSAQSPMPYQVYGYVGENPAVAASGHCTQR